jgi:hypothetical protein
VRVTDLTELWAQFLRISTSVKPRFRRQFSFFAGIVHSPVFITPDLSCTTHRMRALSWILGKTQLYRVLGYIGILAALILSTAGIDRLLVFAVVAGALSVGIGFGAKYCR